MNGFKLWIFSLCGAVAVTALFKILLSGSKLKRTLDIFFSLFVLLYTVIPLTDIRFENLLFGDASEEAVSFDEYYEEGYKSYVEQSVRIVCEDMSIKVLSVDISSYIDDEGCLVIESLSIETDSGGRSEEIKAEIKKRLGFEVIVS